MREEYRVGIQAWAEMCWKEDWLNQRRWWTRLVNWYNWKFRGIYTAWHDPDEISASIHGYIDRAGAALLLERKGMLKDE